MVHFKDKVTFTSFVSEKQFCVRNETLVHVYIGPTCDGAISKLACRSQRPFPLRTATAAMC